MWLIYALAASVFFGVRGSLYQWSSQQNMNRNVMLCGVFSTGAVLGAVLAWLFGSNWTGYSLIGILMGLFSFIASMSMYRGFAVGKASIVAILTGLPPVVVVILAFALWSEKLSVWQGISFLVILGGIVMIRYSSDLSIKQLRGAGWGLLCMLFFGLNDVTSKLTIRLGADFLPTLFFMFATGTVCFYVWYRLELRKSRGSGAHPETELMAKFNKSPWSNRRAYVWGTVVGTTNVAGMILILHAFASGITGLVSAVVALNVAIILLYSRLYLKDKFTRLEGAGIAVSLGGIILLRALGG